MSKPAPEPIPERVFFAFGLLHNCQNAKYYPQLTSMISEVFFIANFAHRKWYLRLRISVLPLVQFQLRIASGNSYSQYPVCTLSFCNSFFEPNKIPYCRFADQHLDGLSEQIKQLPHCHVPQQVLPVSVQAQASCPGNRPMPCWRSVCRQNHE